MVSFARGSFPSKPAAARAADPLQRRDRGWTMEEQDWPMSPVILLPPLSEDKFSPSKELV